MKFEIYKDDKREWRFRLKARNGEIIAQSESYKNRLDCLHAVELIKKSAAAKIEFLD
jgi:uncharacterized protein YegP (UPF0339 family)